MPEYLQPSDQMFVFTELTSKDGEQPRTITLSDFDIKPLAFAELVKAQLHKYITIPLEVVNGKIITTDIEGIDRSQYAHVRTTLQSAFTSKAIGLVRGGWLPSAFGALRNRTMVLVDRNIVTEIVRRFEGGMKMDLEPDFLDVFSDMPVRINPALYVMEGNTRAIPGPKLVLKQLDEVILKLHKALPKAILQIGPASFNAILGLIESSRSDMIRNEAFLLRLAPGLMSPISRTQLDQRWNEVLDTADTLNVPRDSLVVLAAL